LGEASTFAVVTGQQVGILGGPLYTLYKTITAIKLCERLRTQLPDSKFVPVFWLEGEDHDFEEDNPIVTISPDHGPSRLEHLIDGKPLERNGGAVGEITLNGSLGQFFDTLKQTLQNSEYTETVLRNLKDCYNPSVSFSRAFASLLNTYFRDDGLVFISSNDKR